MQTCFQAVRWSLGLLMALGLAMVACEQSAEGLRLFGGDDEPAAKGPLPKRYARVALTADETGMLCLVYEASEGTVSGYDTVYTDFGTSVDLETARKVTAEVKKSASGVTCPFPKIALDMPCPDKEGITSSSCSLRLCTCRRSKSEIFCVFADTALRQGATEWTYSCSGRVKPSESPDKAPLLALHGAPKLEVTTRPDRNKKGNLGIGLNLSTGENAVACKKNGKPLEARVTVKTPQGKVVHDATDRIDKFAFG